jgi:hypothetical protein
MLELTDLNEVVELLSGHDSSQLLRRKGKA